MSSTLINIRQFKQSEHYVQRLTDVRSSTECILSKYLKLQEKCYGGVQIVHYSQSIKYMIGGSERRVAQ